MNKVELQISVMRSQITDLEKQIEREKESLQKTVTDGRPYDIITFAPGYIRTIDEAVKEIRNLDEKIKLLTWATTED